MADETTDEVPVYEAPMDEPPPNEGVQPARPSGGAG